MLLDRGYRPGCIVAAIEKARQISRIEALKKVVKEDTQQRSVFAITYDPRLPSVSKIIQKHWRSMIQDPYLEEVFPLPPLVAYKRQPNIKDKLIRAKIPDKADQRPKRQIVWNEKMSQVSHLSICNTRPEC